MQTPKYIAKVINRQALFVAADGTQLSEQPTLEESMLDAFKPATERKYMFVELYSNFGEITGNTIIGMIEEYFAQSNGLPQDIVLYFTRKAGKAYQAQPVGQTWLPTA